MECPVCLTEEVKKMLSLRTCMHAFCQDCLLKIQETANSNYSRCPLCRSIFMCRISKERLKPRTLTSAIISELLYETNDNLDVPKSYKLHKRVSV